MEAIIRQAILHILDTTVEQPDFSDAVMELSPEKTAYLQTCIDRLAATDDARLCQLKNSSAFGAELAQNNDFIDLSRRIAGVMFDFMHAHPQSLCFCVPLRHRTALILRRYKYSSLAYTRWPGQSCT